METNPKLIVLQLKDLILTLALIVLGVLLIILIVFMFLPKKNSSKTSANIYSAGSYSSSITVNGTPLEITVSVDNNRIKAINATNLSTTITTMYPLFEPALADISKQVIDTQTTANVYINEDAVYTGTVIITAINAALEKAKLP